MNFKKKFKNNHKINNKLNKYLKAMYFIKIDENYFKDY